MGKEEKMQFESRWEKQQRLKRQKRSGVAGLVTAAVLVILLGVAMWNGKQSLVKKNDEYEARKAQLEQQINEQQERKSELEEYEKYVQTKKFVEETAKDKFGLIYPDEIVIKPEN